MCLSAPQLKIASTASVVILQTRFIKVKNMKNLFFFLNFKNKLQFF